MQKGLSNEQRVNFLKIHLRVRLKHCGLCVIKIKTVIIVDTIIDR